MKILVIGLAILLAAATGAAQNGGGKRNVIRRDGVVRVGPATTYLKEGLSTEQVLSLLGEPSATHQRVQDTRTITIYEFPRSEGRVLIAEFVSDTLVSSRIETRAQIARSAS